MKTKHHFLLIYCVTLAGAAVVSGQEAAGIMAAMGQYGGGGQGGTDAVATGPAADPRPRSVGPGGDSTGRPEPWQVWAQQPVAAPLQLEVNVQAESGTQVTLSIAGQNYTVDGAGLGVETATNRFYPNLKSYEDYVLSVSGPNWEYVKAVFKGYTPRHLLSRRGPRAIPRPFKALVNGQDFLDTDALEATLTAGNNATNWVVEVRPDRGLRPVVHQAYEEVWTRDEDASPAAPGDGEWPALGPGRATTASSGAFRWSLDLGRLWTGLPAGKLRLFEQTVSSNLYNGAALSYTARSTNQAELHVITNGSGVLRQIKAPQAMLDIQSTSSPTQECLVRCYIPAHVGAYTNGLYSILTNSPFVTWQLRNPDSPGTYYRFQVVEERPASRTYTAELSYSNSVWQLTYGSGSEARTERRTVSINGNSRQETEEIRWQTNVVYKAIEGYLQFPWGWELTNVVTNPDGNALTNRFVYYTDASPPEAYGRLKERWFPGGRWELYCYPYMDEYAVYHCAGWPDGCGDFDSYLGDKTAYLIRLRPWKDAPASPSTAVLSNIVATESRRFDAAVGAHESHRATELGFDQDGVPVVLDMEPVADGDYSQPEGSFTADDWRWRGEVNNSFTHTRRFRQTGSWLNDLVFVQHLKTAEADLFEYQRGFFNPTNLTWAADDTNGVDVAKLKTSGMDYYWRSSYPNAWYSAYLPYEGTEYGIDCFQGKSTQELTIHQGGNPVFLNLAGMSNIVDYAPVFRLIETRRRGFDSLGHLTNEVWYDGVSNTVSRTVYQASWKDASGNDTELQAWEVNELGERFNYTYDGQKRRTGVTRVGVGSVGGYPAQADLSTNWVYNVAGWLTQETVSAGALALSRSQSYDAGGRLVRSTSFDGVSVTNSYSADTRTTTETFPGSLSKTTTRYLDGRLKSVTGDTVVAEYHDYRIDPTADPLSVGTGVERIYYGVTNSARWTEQARTSFGQIATKRMPAFAITNGAPPLEVVTSFYDDLAVCPMDESPASVTTPATVALAEGEYQIQNLLEYNNYDLYGWAVARPERSGYGSWTRAQAQDTTLEWDSGNWWHVTRQWWNTVGQTRTNVTWKRLTGFSTGTTIEDMTAIDPNGNVTTILITVDQANKKLTAVTNTPRSTIDVTGVTINGLLQSVNPESYSGLTCFYYDALRRPVATKSALGFATGSAYDSSTGWVLAATNAAGRTTQFEYYTAGEANSGKVKCQTDPNGKKTYSAYNSRGQPTRQWGDVPYPEERVYSSFAELTELRTYQGGSNWSSASWPGGAENPDVTTWTYDTATGLVLGKFDDAGRGYTNMYHATRTLWTRHWARGVVVTNTLSAFGEILAKEYSDGTPPVTFGDYYPLGQPSSVTDGVGTAVFTYDEDGELVRTSYTDGPFYGLALTNRIDPVYGLDRMALESEPGEFQAMSELTFDTTSGRMQSVRTWSTNTAGVSATNSVTYGYWANSDLVQTLTAKTNSATVATTSKTWDFGYRLRNIRTVLGTAGATVSSFTYDYDDVDRRTRATLADSSAWAYDYDSRNEVIGGKRYWADQSPVAGQQFEYLYDAIGNRKQGKEGGDGSGGALRTEGYAINHLNQYTARTNSDKVDIIGVATATATVSVNGSTNVNRKGEYYHFPLSAGSTQPALQSVTNTVTQGSSVTYTGALLLPKLTQTLQYDADGNLTNDTVWRHVWDGENRLATLETLTAPTNGVPRVRLDFGYDWQGRRTAKTILTNWNGSVYTTTNTTRYLYHDWLLLVELDESNGLLRTYAWGQDLSGTIDGAAGIGGLVMLTDHSSPATTHFVSYDGNGNLTALVKHDGAVTARYEYGPFGEPIRASGSFARSNPFRWSSRFADDETGLIYYGYRYYSPTLGRWISRDPIEEDGGLNLYGFCGNDGVTAFDMLGMTTANTAELQSTAAIGESVSTSGAGQALTYLRQIRQMVETFNDIQDIASLAVDMFGAADDVFEALLKKGQQVLASGPSGRMGRWQHSVPKFVGGEASQSLIELGGGRHEDFHNILGKYLTAEGLPHGKGGRFNYDRFKKTIGRDRSMRLKVFRALLRASFEFDDKHGGKGSYVVHMLGNVLGKRSKFW